MKYFKNRKITVLFMFVVIMIGISFNSCDELIKNKNSENQKSELTNQAINKNKNEAKLLLMLSKDNQDVINLSKALQEVINKDSIIDLAKKIEQTHVEFAEDLQEVATDKLISIPNYAESPLNKTTVSLTEKDKFKVLNKLKSIIDNQLFILNKLSETSNSKDFKTLIVKADSKINDSLNKTKNILNVLNTNS
ncbi:hypothetical protein [Olleya sp. UBA1516]|uniref:hypothetical protein n=1 Tax=Olleya sp. UBA1516 TaxID=1947013 RepID=UPI0025FDA7F5|nr:hypothetical protein [Olleya sp. UBA1516]|tara:strand:- start:6451 stop:7029 length:579 start_codon:yes stop_codon:yes gene_type:complete